MDYSPGSPMQSSGQHIAFEASRGALCKRLAAGGGSMLDSKLRKNNGGRPQPLVFPEKKTHDATSSKQPESRLSKDLVVQNLARSMIPVYRIKGTSPAC